MANLLQSAQTQATTSPGFYTDYLSNIAQKGTAAQGQAQFVGAQPLQTKAFETICQTTGQYQPSFQQGQELLGQAAGQNITGATAPYLQAATTASPLSAAQPLICEAAGYNLGCAAASYMSPYASKVAQGLSDIGQRNIRQNLSPMATAAAVGSGQFGSQRGAQVLGQITEQANQDLNTQIAQVLNQGFAQGLCAAKAKQGALSQLAGTTVTAQQAQNAANLQAAATAGCAAAKQALAKTQAGLGLGTLGTQGATTNLACINALAKLGEQQQTIGQNEQLFPLTSLSSLASLLSGYTMPTTTKTTLCMSPFSGMAALGSGALGMLTPRYDASGKPIEGSSPLDLIKGVFGSKPSSTTPGGATAPSYTQDASGTYVPSDSSYNELIAPSDGGYNDYPNYSEAPDELPWWAQGCAAGGPVQSHALGGPIGCGSSMGMGAVPAGLCYAACMTCTPMNRTGGISSGISVGCSSTQNLGGMPNMG